MIDNKRGQGLSTNAIILIVLGVVVLVILITGFTLGWSKIAPFLSKDNVDTITTNCEIACSTNAKYDYTGKIRELNDGEIKIKTTCKILAKTFTKYQISSCPSINAIQNCEDLKINDKNGELSQIECNGDNQYDLSNLAGNLDAKTNTHCCIPKN